jgi:glycosyltransferase involved in cell wall biosynthesis
MRILFLARRFYPEVGGVEKHCLKIARELVEKGHEISVITEASAKNNRLKRSNYHSLVQSDTYEIKQNQPVKSTSSKQLISSVLKVYRFRFGPDNFLKKFRVWNMLFRERNLILSSDIIHCHDVFFWYLPFKVLYPRKKVYTTFHGYESYPIRINAIIIRKFSEWLSSGTICVGDFMKKWYFHKPDYVIYGGVNIPKTKTQKLKPKNGALFIGRLDEQTGIKEYCLAVKKIKEKIPDFDFVTAGDGKFGKFAEKYGEVLGFIENPELKLSDFRFAFVSRYLSILEALSAKRLVFALYDNPLKEDYLRMAPFAKYINILNNPIDLASLVQYYYSNTKLEQKRVNSGYNWVKKYTWKHVAGVYERLWGLK